MTLDMERPRQAVILAGGRGTRLRPLTDSLPKPMIHFHGKPFLEYLIIQLKEQGFERVLLLLGYLPHIIKDHFGNGSSFGLKIDYSISDAENETGRRIILAKDKLDPCFFLLYCDNYWPIRIDQMWRQFLSANTAAQITVYSNKDNYTRHNVLTENSGLVSCYDKNRSCTGLQGVDIGFAFIKKEVLALIPDENVNFEKVVYPVLVEKRQLSAYITDHRYYSVGSYERLSLTESFFKRQPAIILDRDGVLNEKPPKGNYVRSRNEFKWRAGAKEAVNLLKSASYTIIIVSNQAGIGRGMMTEDDLANVHEKMREELLESGGSIDAIYYCPHDWDDGCECRKPNPGMLLQAQRDFHLDLTETFFIGDDIRDKQAGDAAGCKTLLLTPGMSLLDVVKEKILHNSKGGKENNNEGACYRQ